MHLANVKQETRSFCWIPWLCGAKVWLNILSPLERLDPTWLVFLRSKVKNNYLNTLSLYIQSILLNMNYKPSNKKKKKLKEWLFLGMQDIEDIKISRVFFLVICKCTLQLELYHTLKRHLLNIYINMFFTVIFGDKYTGYLPWLYLFLL